MYIFEQFEHKELKERRLLLLMADYLLANWPTNFIKVCKQNRIWIELLFRVVNNEDDLPYWYWTTVIQNLNKRITRHDFHKQLESWRQKNKNLIREISIQN
jgi:hypothetical protein